MENNRPLSPFMIGTLYKPQLTSMLSILHRITGAGLGLGAIVVTIWLWTAVIGDDAFAMVQSFRVSLIGQVMLFCWLFAFIYHFFNGIRHLKWDLGYGFNLQIVYLTGWIVTAASIVLTCLIWSSI
jgi:succinate dehydrogenase / fumarate reductase, cytochrome b subunit